MNGLRIAVRVDAGPRIGTGHWMRCRALALELRRRGADLVFISREAPAALAAELPRLGIGLERLPPRSPDGGGAGASPPASWLTAGPAADAAETVASIGRRFGRVDWLLVDHYGIDARWHHAVRAAARALMVIDDQANRALNADLVLDQGFRQDGSDYRPRLQRPAPVLPGARHALLHEDFARLRAAALARRAQAGPPARILVSFGGVDVENHASSALAALAAESPGRLEIDLICGAAAPHLDTVRRLAAAHPQRVRVSLQVDDMAHRMLLADVAFGACGTTSWERCCLGLPTVAMAVAENQSAAADALARTGAAAIVSLAAPAEAGLREAWRRLRDEPGRRAAMAAAAAQVCDGEGARRVAAVMASWPVLEPSDA